MAEKLRAMKRFSNEHKMRIIIIFMVFCVILVVLITLMSLKNYRDSQKILQESIEKQMTSMAFAAEEAIDVDKFLTYNSAKDMAKDKDYQGELARLKTLADTLGAKYLYALKEIDGKYYFVYDTDPEDYELFDQYDLEDVHKIAFTGKPAAAAYNSNDAYGSFSMGAVPLFHNGKVVGVVAADVEDTFVEAHRDAQLLNAVILIAIILLTLVIMAFLLIALLRKIKNMQDTLYHQSHYDKLTELPNRQFLFEHLVDMTQKSKNTVFSLFFIDLDNFKSVNDTAGHDAGDELLVHIGKYLSTAHKNTAVFRPSAGVLNVAARIGGDEFILVVPDLTEGESLKYGQELITGLRTNVDNKNIEKFDIGFSIGIALYPKHSENYHVLIKYADIAMYHAKNAGKNTCLVYHDEMKNKDEK